MKSRLTFVDRELLRQEESEGRYGADAQHHLARARFLLSINSGLVPPSACFYAATEYRFCIERLLFTILVVISGEDSVTRTQEKLYTGSSLKHAIRQAEPLLLRKLEYIDLILIATGTCQRTAKPDLDRLSEMHGRLGGYLHAQKRPSETTWFPGWISAFESFLIDCDDYLGELLALDKVIAGMPESEQEFQQWMNGKLSDDNIIAAARTKR